VRGGESHVIRALTNGKTSYSDPLHYLALIEQKVNALIRLHHWPVGGCRRSSPPAAIFWKPGWVSRASREFVAGSAANGDIPRR